MTLVFFKTIVRKIYNGERSVPRKCKDCLKFDIATVIYLLVFRSEDHA